MITCRREVSSSDMWGQYMSCHHRQFMRPVWDHNILILLERYFFTLPQEHSLHRVYFLHNTSGQYFDLARLAKKCREYGVIFLVDLAHAVGNVELKLHEWGIDGACWCTYKYLNSGPGCVGGFFVHEKWLQRVEVGGAENASTVGAAGSNHDGKEGGGGAENAAGGEASVEGGTVGGTTALKRLHGWWSHSKDTRFEMRHALVPAVGAKAWAMSNPGVLGVMSLLGSLRVFDQV